LEGVGVDSPLGLGLGSGSIVAAGPIEAVEADPETLVGCGEEVGPGFDPVHAARRATAAATKRNRRMLLIMRPTRDGSRWVPWADNGWCARETTRPPA
jgi:hypothetical protein